MSVLAEIQKARIKLVLDQPFIGQLVLQLQPQEVEWCSTAATDGRYFYYNHDFVRSLSGPNLVFLTAHEVLHVVFEHIFRRGGRDKNLWGMAADYIVNHVLVKAGIGRMPKSGLYNPEYTDEYTVEELYALLEKNTVTIEMPLDMHLDLSPSGQNNGSAKVLISGEDGPPSLTEEEIQEIRDTIRATLIQTAQQVDPGNIPAGLQRLLNRLLEPKIDWRQMLDTTLRSTIKHDYTYSRLSRRYWSTGLVLPGQDMLDKVTAVAFIDGSGSTTQEMITDFLAECKGIMSTFRDFELTVGSFDVKVYNVKVYTPDNGDDIDKYQFYGGGGTMPSCCWEYMRTEEIVPHKLLIFTDGHVGDDWGDSDYADTLFIVHSNPQIKAPYGITVSYP